MAPTSVSISTNGTCEVVSVNGTFPAGENIFRVVSIAKNGKSVKIGIVGGAYDSGAAAITLELGKKLTLVNTADGTRYVLLLQSKCDVATSPVSSSAGTTPTSTVAAPTTTTHGHDADRHRRARLERVRYGHRPVAAATYYPSVGPSVISNASALPVLT